MINRTASTGVKSFISFLNSRRSYSRANNRIVLLEMQSNKSYQIAQSIFLEASLFPDRTVVAYSPYLTTSRIKIYFYRLMLLLGILRSEVWPYAIYKAMGVSEIFFLAPPRFNSLKRKKLRRLFSSMTKSQILNFNFCDIRVGEDRKSVV